MKSSCHYFNKDLPHEVKSYEFNAYVELKMLTCIWAYRKLRREKKLTLNGVEKKIYGFIGIEQAFVKTLT